LKIRRRFVKGGQIQAVFLEFPERDYRESAEQEGIGGTSSMIRVGAADVPPSSRYRTLETRGWRLD
jgi:hypothetical protein